mmetsp:Transcript_38903/g.70157  ORF Transcript_38903/g.70157 Transcript_38903/m.70157 type:complete len:185 (+) Transcript_38903:113-667(+)
MLLRRLLAFCRLLAIAAISVEIKSSADVQAQHASIIRSQRPCKAGLKLVECHDGDVAAASLDFYADEWFEPLIFFNGNWHPICKYRFMDRDHGASTVCRLLGFEKGELEVLDTILTQDAMSVGDCLAHENLTRCTAGGNQFGFLPAQDVNCSAGDPSGLMIRCLVSPDAPGDDCPTVASCQAQL